MNHTFVICAYKESQYLEECVRSLLKQEIKSNVIMVTSTPNAFIDGIAEKYHIPCYVNEGQGGITQDWNFGYKTAVEKYHPEYITIAHQDDIYNRTYLKEIMQGALRAKKALIIFSDYYEIRGKEKVLKNKILTVKRLLLLPLRMKILQRSKWVRRRILSLGSPICCPAVTFHVNELPEVIFENHYRACEDWEAWEKISRCRGEFVFVPKLLVGHRIHEESETSASILDNQRTKEELEMFCKFWPHPVAKMISNRYATAQDFNYVNDDK